MQFFPLFVLPGERRRKRTSAWSHGISVNKYPEYYMHLRHWRHVTSSFGGSCRSRWGATKTFGSNGRKRRRLSRDCQEIRRIVKERKRERKRQGEKESISGIENNHDRGRRCEGAERIRWFRVREGTDDDGCLLLLSGAFAFPSPVCFATRGTRVLHVHQREGRCRVLVISLVLFITVVITHCFRCRYTSRNIKKRRC